ncbi:GIY-YIG nuclease family protein [Cuspidothrix issatschenkoi LEGE 03284]|uniref:GIY-YIG nuclease family protein n=1 Tax=Cuspidothrix issatschenkoi TaxID=230752 RepID=UPI001881684F|nr:GIY-YIG nuclease family protein [Cuspidothrix issatschenkoi]MBE9233667.1 GIY-YIG nuclease family protein [Cuspidothrix issatschenkoi LEGE 03284]
MFVYLIRDGETSLYKIGMTHNLESRLKRLNGNQSPNEKYIVFYIEVINAKPIEAILHNRYQKHRHRNEWFCLNDKQVESVKQNMNLMKNHEQILYSDDYEEENNDYEDEDDEVSDRVLEVLAYIESLKLQAIDLLELANRLTAIAMEKLKQEEETDTDDEEYEEEDEDQE